MSWALDSIWDFFLGWLLLVLLYRLVPTVRLHLKAIMIGAFVASLLLLIGKESLGLYFDHAISLKQMYGSLGLVPIFMFWLYLMWLIILLGLQVAAIVHNVADSN
jgi:membrane protein